MHPELAIIKLFLQYTQWKQYSGYIAVKWFQDDLQPIYRILNKYHEDTPETNISVLDLISLININLNSNKEYYINIINNINTIDINNSITIELINSIKRNKLLKDISIKSYEVTEGKSKYEELIPLLLELDKPDTVVEETQFITDDLNILLSDCVTTPGLRWRLNGLNKSLGSLRDGDFGFIFARPESFSRDTEILTPKGWIKVDQVTTDTYISQVNSDLSVSFVKPIAVHPHKQTHCYHIHDELGRVDLIVTQGHGMIYEKDGKLYKERADQVKYKQGIKHHVSASSSVKENVEFLPEHRLLIAYQADGHTRNYKEYGYTFSFKKERKKNRLKEVLSLCDYEYTEYKDGNRGHTGYYIKSKIRLYKDFDWVNLALVSKEWCQQFIEELSYWDATRRTETRFKFDTIDFNVASKVQAIAILAGYNCLLSTNIDNRSPNYSNIYSLSIRTNYQPIDGQSIKKELIPFSDTTYCFEVESGMLLVRRNGAVAVSGNTGKTTLLASESTFFAEQVHDDKGPGIWINNEEQNKKVKLRTYQAALGITMPELMAKPEFWMKVYREKIRNKLVIPDMSTYSYKDIERLCEVYQPSFLVLDQIDKIKGFKADRDDLMLGAMYQWARELAKEYCPVIAVCQADGTGENQKWLTMANVANAKTSKQAEADWILGVGKIHEPGWDSVRFMNISKNKLFGDPDSDPTMKHGKFETIIEPLIARYRDV